jgi:hypothetical protein
MAITDQEDSLLVACLELRLNWSFHRKYALHVANHVLQKLSNLQYIERIMIGRFSHFLECLTLCVRFVTNEKLNKTHQSEICWTSCYIPEINTNELRASSSSQIIQ